MRSKRLPGSFLFIYFYLFITLSHTLFTILVQILTPLTLTCNPNKTTYTTYNANMVTYTTYNAYNTNTYIHTYKNLLQISNI